MLSEESKEEIRKAYTGLIEGKRLSPRWGQRQMIAEIANTLARMEDDDPEATPQVAIEAGTGTGKTIAYTVAAIPLARAMGKTLVISTATIALQEQLVLKDLPDIRRHSGLAFDFVLAKGRRRYICLSRLDRLLASGGGDDPVIPLYPDEVAAPGQDALPVYQSMAEALGRGEWDGDRDAWPEEVANDTWFSVTTDHSQCSGRRCPNVGQCSFFKARDSLQHADVIVTNHDLVLSDLALGGGAILTPPEDTVYIFDEGHHLPAKALNHFSAFSRLSTTRQWAEDCQQQLGQGAALLQVAELAEAMVKLQERFEATAAELDAANDLLPAIEGMPEPRDSNDTVHLRFEMGEIPVALAEQAERLARQFSQLHERLQRLENRFEDAMDGDLSGIDSTDAEAWYAAVGAMLGRAEGNLALWSDYAQAPTVGSPADTEAVPMARWVNVIPAGAGVAYELRSSPVLAAEILTEHLWPQAAGVVATSATMTALNSFERFILHSGMPRSGSFKVVPSPFEHQRAELRIPAMDCDPGDPEAHTQCLVENLPAWLDAGEGSLVLFSSRRQLNDVYQGLPAQWRDRILMQGDYSKHEILRRHRERIDSGQGSLIFGLASFAEGVDLPGDYCRHVLIAKIPFAVPDSPLEAALSEWVERRGRNAFMEITVPDAALRLVQACGRLLRTETDSGRVTVCDRRLVTRRYGKALLEALPAFRLAIE